MAITESSLEANFNTYIGDTTTDRISATERLQLATEGVTWLLEETGNDHSLKTYVLPYYDSVHYYKTTTALSNVLEGADLRRAEADQYQSFLHLSGRELAERIALQDNDSTWSIERHDGDSYLVVNHNSKYMKNQVSSLESLTADGGTWAVDATNSDATNLTIDSVDFQEGSGSFNFDVTVAQSGNNRATIQNSTLTSMDLTDYNDLASWIFWVYIPDVTHFTSVTLYWGSSTTAYWSITATTDINGAAFANGWNRIKLDWASSTMTLTPDVTAVNFVRIDYNYTGSQVDETDFRWDDLRLIRPEDLTFYYTSWTVGTTNTGTALNAFGATTDVPFFSGQYDQYKYAVAHKMASIAFYGILRNPTQGQMHENEALKSLERQKTLIPSAVTKEEKNFKPRGINFSRGGRLIARGIRF